MHSNKTGSSGNRQYFLLDFCLCTLENCIYCQQCCMCACWSQQAKLPLLPSLPDVLNTQLCACGHTVFNPNHSSVSPNQWHGWMPKYRAAASAKFFHFTPSSGKWQETLASLWELCSLKALGEWGLRPWVAEILTSGPTASPHLKLLLFKWHLSTQYQCYLSGALKPVNESVQIRLELDGLQAQASGKISWTQPQSS